MCFREITVVAVVMPVVPVWQQQSQRARLRSISVRSAARRLQPRSVRSWVWQPRKAKRKVAFVKCAGTCEKAGRDYEYTGNEDCAAMAFVPNGGPKSCNYGCLGYGSCVKACPFDAIHIVDGIAQVDKEVCKACGKCVAACPKHLIELVPYDAKHIVQCSSKDKGKDVMKACSVGCIGCHLCEKNCPKDAVHVIDNVAYIDQKNVSDAVSVHRSVQRKLFCKNDFLRKSSCKNRFLE